jgi:hypothetical protein
MVLTMWGLLMNVDIKQMFEQLEKLMEELSKVKEELFEYYMILPEQEEVASERLSEVSE